MKYSIVDYLQVKSVLGFRIDAGYWHPEFVENSQLVSADVRIRDFVEENICNIKSSPIDKNFKYLEISKISLNGYEYETTDVLCGEEPDRAHHILQKGDIAVSTVRPNRNAVAFIQEDGVVGSSGLSVLRARNIEGEYLLAFCKTDYFIKCLMRANKASMYPAVSNNDVLNMPLFVPSDTFKSLIVKIIRKSFACLGKAKEAYNDASSLFLSELGLADWKPQYHLTFVKNYSDIKQAKRIDAGYFQPKYDEIIHAIRKCSGGWDILENLTTVKKCVEVGKKAYLAEGIPFVRVSNLSPFRLTKAECISEELYHKIKQHQPRKGEILFSKDATPGVAYYLDETPQKMIPSSGVLRLKNKTDKVNNEYLTLALNSVLIKEQVKRDCGGSVILHWRPDQVKRTLIPILSREKQKEIQQKVKDACNFRKQSEFLLNCAKRAIETAMKKNEQVALRWLESETKGD